MSLQKYNAVLTSSDAKKIISEYFVWEVDNMVQYSRICDFDLAQSPIGPM